MLKLLLLSMLGVSLTVITAKSLSDCLPPKNAVEVFWLYDGKPASDAGRCTDKHDKAGAPWMMLNAYRSGGRKNVHWIYVDPNKAQSQSQWCVTNWTYYQADGITPIATIAGTTTTLADKHHKPWCGIVTYRPGGVRGYQWEYCRCPSDWPQPPPPSPIVATRPPITRTPRPRHTLGA